MEQEIWKDIPNYEGFYQASNLGRIRSVDRYVYHGTRKRFWKGQIIKPKIDHDYYSVCLSKHGKIRYYRVHRLVAFAFIVNPQNKPYINHIDGNKRNNRVENLEWCTASENNIHAMKTGLIDIEKAVETARKNFKDSWGQNKRKIVQLNPQTGEAINVFNSIKEAAINCGICGIESHITQCCNGKRNTAGGYAWVEYKDYLNGFQFVLQEDKKRGKLTPRQRKEISEKYLCGKTTKELCEEYGVSGTVIRKALYNNNVKPDVHRGKHNIDLKILLAEFKDGKTNIELAKKYNCDKSLISRRRSQFRKEGKLL